jgi:hypothetical protein
LKLGEMVKVCACLLMAGGLAGAGTVSFTLYSTGFSSTGSELNGGAHDGNWTLISDPSGSVTTPEAPYVTNGCTLHVICTSFPFTAWTSDTLSSEWISPRATEAGSQSDPAGEYIYQETFNLTGLDPASVVITGKWTADNYGYIVVNGTRVSLGTDGNIPNAAGEFKNFTSFVLNSSNANFVSGINTIQFDVFNTTTGSPDITGLDVDFRSATASPTPEPASLTLMSAGMVALGLFARKRAADRRS